jgi:hypothetical protein
VFFFSALKSYRGAFHMSPDYAWRYGYADVLGHLASIRDERRGGPQANAVHDRDMVLAVLGGLYLAWRGWRRLRPPRPA